MNYLIENIKSIISKNLDNTGIQTYLKSKGDAFFNPINYELDDIEDMVKLTDKDELIVKTEIYTIPSKKQF